MATPLEVLDAMIEESDDLITVDTPVKAAWRALSENDKREAEKQLLARHNADTYHMRPRRR